MEEKNELNDIILNKSAGASGNKKIVLAVATLGIILIIVVLLMNTLTSGGTDNLPKSENYGKPKAVLPPEPVSQVDEEPLFEEVEVLKEDVQENDSLDKIAQRLKQESLQKKKEQPSEPIKEIVEEELVEVTPVKEEVVAKKVEAKKVQKPKAKPAKKAYYIQVGSFTKYEPNKKFLKSITSQGFKYKYHKVIKNSKKLNKVLVGPFKNEKEARDALRTIRTNIEAGAFLVRV